MISYEILLIFSIIIFILSILVNIFYKKTLKNFIFGVTGALLFVFLAYQATLGSIGPISVMTAIYNTFRVYLFNEDLGFILEAFSYKWIKFYISILYILAPVLLITSIITYIAEISTKFKIFYSRILFSDIYLFSEINEKSVLLAMDIYKSHKKKAFIVFAGRPESLDGEIYDFMEQTKKIKAICVKGNVTEFKWIYSMKKKTVNWILCSVDQYKNLQMGITINERFKQLINGSIYVFSEQIEAEMLLDTMEKEKIKIRRVNEKRAIIQKLMLDQPIYMNHSEGLMHLVVIGAGNMGREFVKTAAWCGQMEGFKLKITIADCSNNAFESLCFQCPELIETCDITFKQTDVTTPQLWDLLSENLTATYIVVALPTDDLCSKTAILVRSFFEQKKFSKKMPLINVSITSPEKAKLLANLTNGQGQSYGLLPFGNKNDLYQKSVILQNDLEKMALSMHIWAGYEKSDFDAMEYNRKSSIATALHISYKLHSAGVDSCKAYAEYIENPENKDRQVRAEHERWNAYMRSEGYTFANLIETESYLKILGNHKNVMAMKHSCLIGFDELDILTTLVKPYKQIDFKKQDMKSIEWVSKGCP